MVNHWPWRDRHSDYATDRFSPLARRRKGTHHNTAEAVIERPRCSVVTPSFPNPDGARQFPAASGRLSSVSTTDRVAFPLLDRDGHDLVRKPAVL